VVENMETLPNNHVGLTTSVVAAYVSNNRVQSAELPTLISDVHTALSRLGQSGASEAPPVQKLTPAQIRKSITPDALISFIDGKPYKTLKRHLSKHGLNFDDYRTRFGLPLDYPAVAASYSETRSTLAKNFGLGQQRRTVAAKTVNTVDTVAETYTKAEHEKNG
jgi:predicted transcriptional regulator